MRKLWLLTASVTWVSASAAMCQQIAAPDTVAIRVGSLRLRGLVWKPQGHGPFPGILFNHGSYETRDSLILTESAAIGPVLARSGYVTLVLFRQGTGLSAGQGVLGGDLMARAYATGGNIARNKVQLDLMLGDELQQAQAGLDYLKSRRDVRADRLGLVGHSFGGSLSLLLAARNKSIKTIVTFGAAAGSWNNSPELRAQLTAAINRTRAPVLLIHAANDYSTSAGKALAAELKRLGRYHVLRIYPSYGSTARDGHNIVYRDPSIWKSDVDSFLSLTLH